MTTWLDRQIEQLESCVERCLNLCNATWNGMRCTLPADHSTKQHRFPAEFLSAQSHDEVGAIAAELTSTSKGRDSVRDQREGDAGKQQAFEEMVTHAFRLPPVFRKAFLLCDVQGLSIGETAAILGISLGAVQARLYRARREMQIRLRVGR